LAANVLKVVQNSEPHREIKAEQILACVSEHYREPPESLRGRKRTNQIAFPRQVGMYLCRVLTQMSLVEIGQVFGGRDHTTVIYGCDRISSQLATDRDLRESVERLTTKLREGRP
jgi:chromosomal replication initiator protein